MPTYDVSLPEELDRFVAAKVQSGAYQNLSEVIQAGLRALELEDEHREMKLANLRAAVEEGRQSGVAEGDVFADIRKQFNLPPFQG